MLLSRRSKGRGKRRQGGQILVLFELSLIVMLGFVALVVDLGLLRNNRQILVNTIDAAALAGGSRMPVSGAAGAASAKTLIDYEISIDYPGLPTTAYTITYRCLIGANDTGPLISRDVPAVCDPHNALGHNPPVASDFIGAGPTRNSACNPKLGDTCNVVVVAASSTTQYAIAPVVGVNSGSSGTVSSASCKGPCGAAPVGPVDVVIITDRTQSMTSTDVGYVQTGANTVLKVYDPNIQRVALGAIGPSQINGDGTPKLVSCPTSSTGYAANHSIGSVLAVGQGYSSNGMDINYFGPAPTDLGRWIPVGFTGLDTATPAVKYHEAYSTGGVINTSSKIAKAISCEVSYTLGTNLDTPIREAGYYLHTYGRPGVKKGIIIETDGTPQAGDGSVHYTCTGASAAATAVKAMSDGILIYTIGYGMDSSKNCPTHSSNGNESNAWSGKSGKSLLQNMASDSSKFYDSPASSAVASAFLSAAVDLAGGGAHLIQLYPAPVVTNASGGTTISGKYFTGATSVRFGMALATSCAVTSDKLITCSAIPAGTHGTTVDVVVTTPGGISPISAGDHYTYP